MEGLNVKYFSRNRTAARGVCDSKIGHSGLGENSVTVLYFKKKKMRTGNRRKEGD